MNVHFKMARGSSFFRAWCPALPGCFVVGQSRQEIQQRMATAIDGYLASLAVALPRELANCRATKNALVRA